MNTEDVWMDHWKDMERYGKIWKDMERYGKIWKDNYRGMLGNEDVSCYVNEYPKINALQKS